MNTYQRDPQVSKSTTLGKLNEGAWDARYDIPAGQGLRIVCARAAVLNIFNLGRDLVAAE
jgi:hypothetical protein